MTSRRIFISAASNKWLDERRRSLKAAIIKSISDAGYEPQEFWESGIPENLAWSFESVDQVMRQCVGAVVLGFKRWSVSLDSEPETHLIGEYNHYEGAVALTQKLPVFLLSEEGAANRGIIWTGGGKTITFIPEAAEADWVRHEDFTKRLGAWRKEIQARSDVFLGYCSKSAGTAAQIENRLTRLGASVKNWAMDFRAGVSILEEIENARTKCSCGIFLFTEDDPIEGISGGAAPRDNVVFEAGYFMSAKGPGRCLIIREGGAKMPADLGGSIYLNLQKGQDVSAIDGKLASFLKDNL